MGACIICGKPAGFFKKSHPECMAEEEKKIKEESEKRSSAIANLVSRASNSLEFNESIDDIEKAIQNCIENRLSDSEIRSVLIEQWTLAVDRFLDDGVIDNEELSRLTNYLASLNIAQSEVDRNGHFRKVVKGVVLHELLNGIIPDRFRFNDEQIINLKKGEKIIWGFQETKHIEIRTLTERVGGSQGVSIKLMTGVYYRIGAFKSKPVERSETRHLDTGWLIFTNQNIYFVGKNKSTRIPYKNIVSMTPYSDGFGIMLDSPSAKPTIFINDDPWFSFNLLTNLAQNNG